MKFTAILALLVVGGLSCCSDSFSAVKTPIPFSTSYALRPCSTCREVVYATEAQCRAAAFAEAERAGATRTTGSAVYTCITRFNVIATFVVGQSGTAVLSWSYSRTADRPLAEGFRVVYGSHPLELVNTVQLGGATVTTHTLTGLAPGTYYFAVKAFAGSNESEQSNTVSKVVF